MNIWKKILGIIYPKTCCFCGKVSDKELCKDCAEKVVYITEPRCKKCGKPVRYAEQEYCYDCQKNVYSYDQGRSIWIHKMPVSMSIYQFKYKNRRIYGEFYAKEMIRIYGRLIREWEIEVIVPIPLHRKKKRFRGYNQAEIVAKHLGEMMGIPVDSRSVIRSRYTRPQKELNDKERKQNLKHAFSVTGQWKNYKTVLVIDDIYTTGSIIDTVAEELKSRGVQKVCFLTISIGQGY